MRQNEMETIIDLISGASSKKAKQALFAERLKQEEKLSDETLALYFEIIELEWKNYNQLLSLGWIKWNDSASLKNFEILGLTVIKKDDRLTLIRNTDATKVLYKENI